MAAHTRHGFVLMSSQSLCLFLLVFLVMMESDHGVKPSPVQDGLNKSQLDLLGIRLYHQEEGMSKGETSLLQLS